MLNYINSMIFDEHPRMNTTRKTITVTDQQDAWIKARIAAGDYTNDSEYIRDLIRHDQEQSAKLDALRAAIQAGIDSGVSPRSAEEIWANAMEAARGGRRSDQVHDGG